MSLTYVGNNVWIEDSTPCHHRSNRLSKWRRFVARLMCRSTASSQQKVIVIHKVHYRSSKRQKTNSNVTAEWQLDQESDEDSIDEGPPSSLDSDETPKR